ncbi:acyl-CoA dehydrogenase family protein [Aquincola tertiaricarbonis]|uniref:Acyl-CoA dehydrogenase family protein n=1 Tax=Aquincola tertiaricarbonis TaxID=391953 RepID=A0ABY4S6R8_AQUTE|nr:acyl-CoA dehydrogenase family protein [Aquincola tertiaricarbonis]URI07587.1 acyl-CoA dehydrogenase family protein [Aquincola tertiaricarbonis]
MGLFDTPELRAFRAEVRAFLAEHLDDELVQATRAGLHLPRETVARWQAALGRRGWGAPHWPASAGGPGWDEARRYIFEEETAFADAPLGDVLGLFLAGPMLIAEGSPAQRARYLPGILHGQEFWCQGFSEPNAGSDLASLKTTARLEGDEWVIDGQKTWLSGGHMADQMFLLARTEPLGRPQAGLSMFVVDMRLPGLSLQPILTIDEGHSVNALFIDGVRIPAANLVGQRGQGWTYAKDLLARERVNNAQAARTKRDIVALEQLARRLTDDAGRPLADDPRVRRRLASLTADFIALESAVLGVVAEQMAGREPGPAASTLKIRGSELQQRVTETAMGWLGRAGLLLQPGYGSGPLDEAATGWVERHLFRRVVTIYAGSNEIQKSIIAKSLLGM